MNTLAKSLVAVLGFLGFNVRCRGARVKLALCVSPFKPFRMASL